MSFSLKQFLKLQGINKVKDIKLVKNRSFTIGLLMDILNNEPGRLDPEPFEPADVVVYENDGTNISNLVDDCSGNFGYSHMAVIVPKENSIDLELIHAWTPAERLTPDNWPKVRVDQITHHSLVNRPRIPVKINLSEIQKNKFYSILRKKVGKMYDFGELLSTIDWIPKEIAKFLNSEDAEMCSDLVINSLEEVGFDCSSAGLTEFESPNDFARAFGARKGKN